MENRDSCGTPPDHTGRRQMVVDWWMDLSMSGDGGSISWEVLDAIQAEVTSALALGPPGLAQAEHLTAKAMLLVSGLIKL